MSPDQAALPSPDVKRSRPQSFKLCEHVLEDGRTCSAAATRGTNRCRHHSDLERKNREATAADSIRVVPLSDLVKLDVTDARNLATLRQGLLAHMARRSIDVLTARGMHELALAMHKDAHGHDEAKGFTELATSIAAQLSK